MREELQHFVIHFFSRALLPHHLLSVLSFVFTVIFVSKILRERRAPGTTLAWLLSMLLVPYVGVPLYLLLGDRKVKWLAAEKGPLYRKKSQSNEIGELGSSQRLLWSFGIPQQTPHNSFKPLPTGEESYQAIVSSIATAQSSIHVTTFILGRDGVGDKILETLCVKAREGVQVRLLLDGVGSFWFSRKRLRELKRAGGEWALFMPLFRVPFSGHSNLRNHRKMVLVDGQVGILGGMNLAQEYMGPTPTHRRWVDYSFQLLGQVILDLEAVFASDWAYASGEILSVPTARALPVADSLQTPVQLIPSGPDVPGDPLYDTLLGQVFASRRRIWIATPYFIPDESLNRALELACRRGVEVKLLIPLRSNHFVADLCRGSYLRQLQEAGAQVCFFSGPMMHAKLILMDDEFALVGSANLDLRSLFLNYEIGVLLSSRNSTKLIEKWFVDHWAKTLPSSQLSQGQRVGLIRGMIEGFGRLMAPLL